MTTHPQIWPAHPLIQILTGRLESQSCSVFRNVTQCHANKTTQQYSILKIYLIFNIHSIFKIHLKFKIYSVFKIHSIFKIYSKFKIHSIFKIYSMFKIHSRLKIQSKFKSYSRFKIHSEFKIHLDSFQRRSQGFVRSSTVKRLQLQINFVKSWSISSRITSGPGDEVGFVQYSKQLTSLVVAQSPFNVLKVRPITGISHRVISQGLFLSSSPSSPPGKKRLGSQKFDVLIILARMRSFVTEKKLVGIGRKRAMLADNEQARRAANTAIAKPISRSFSCAW